MTLFLFNSKTKDLEELKPQKDKPVSIYVCGATVQDSPHIGHLRAAISFDTLIRYLKFLGHKVRYIRNITDIDDKIINKASENGEEYWERAFKYEKEFTSAYEKLKVLSPTYEPRATSSISEMQELIQKLIDKGHAYIIESGVYFDTLSWKDYGDLTNQKDGDVKSDNQEIGVSNKKDPRDFALWKFVDKDSIGFKSPFINPSNQSSNGWGRPGWHIECSTMALKYLGESFDIHGGGLDLRFPHHENEMAQSNSAGYPFANIWMHSSWVTLKGEKMSKSIGNVLGVNELLSKEGSSPFLLRFVLSTVHYRTNIEWASDTIQKAKESSAKIVEFASSITSFEKLPNSSLFEEFKKCLDEDLNVSKALALIYSQIKDYQKENDKQLANVILTELSVLGINPLDFETSSGKTDTSKYEEVIDNLVEPLIFERNEAKLSRDFSKSDEIREILKEAGITLVDSKEETTWTI